MKAYKTEGLATQISYSKVYSKIENKARKKQRNTKINNNFSVTGTSYPSLFPTNNSLKYCIPFILNENLVVERDKNWLKNEGKNVVRVNGYLQRINRSCAFKRKEYFMDVNGSLAECSWSMVSRKQSAHGSLS